MKAVRGAMTVFILILVALAILGWRWSARLPSAKQQGARVALGLIVVASCGGLGLIWTAKPRDRAES
jgi:MFS superfamily sulfate permease-like transporter